MARVHTMALLSWVLSGVFSLGFAASPAARPPDAGSTASPGKSAADAAPLLEFGELFDASPRSPRPSEQLLALVGKRVRMVGFMVQMEFPARGAFYLTARPVVCDEAGAGSADIPIESVRIEVSSARGEALDFIPGRLAVAGVLELGRVDSPDGHTSLIRLRLEGPRPGAKVTPPPPETATTSHQQRSTRP